MKSKLTPDQEHWANNIQTQPFPSWTAAFDYAYKLGLERMTEAKNLLVDRLAEFTIGREINGGECLLINKLQPELDKIKADLEMASDALKYIESRRNHACQDQKCTCVFDTAFFALEKLADHDNLKCNDPFHSQESISSQVYDNCPTCKGVK